MSASARPPEGGATASPGEDVAQRQEGSPVSALTPAQDPPTAKLLADIRALIEQARQQTAVAVNAGLTLMDWRIGQRIHADVLGGERAAYGEQIVATLSRQWVAEYGRGFAEKNLRRMVQFAQACLTERPPPDVLRRKLHDAVETARARIEAKDVPGKTA